jgi:hypothetical protein
VLATVAASGNVPPVSAFDGHQMLANDQCCWPIVGEVVVKL